MPSIIINFHKVGSAIHVTSVDNTPGEMNLDLIIACNLASTILTNEIKQVKPDPKVVKLKIIASG